MFPAKRPAVLNAVARGMMRHTTAIHRGSFTNLLSEEALEKLATSAWEKAWSRFQIFGNISAGVIGIFLTMRLVKLVLDTFIHGFALHSVYGCSVHLMGAFWDSLTQLLLLLGEKKKDAKAPEDPSLESTEQHSPNPVIASAPPNSLDHATFKSLQFALPREENTTAYTLGLQT